MDKESVKKALDVIKKDSKKRKFKQTVDFIIILKNLDLKKPEQQVDFYQQIKHDSGKTIKLCALVGPELMEQAKKTFDTAILSDDFVNYAKDKKKTKKLATEHDYFVAQANIMPQVAGAFGRVLGPKGKMPNPKSGCVVPTNANLGVLAPKLKKMVRISAKTMPMIQLRVGKEDSNEDEVIDNILTIYDGIIHHLPSGLNNVRKTLLKLTMGKPTKIE